MNKKLSQWKKAVVCTTFALGALITAASASGALEGSKLVTGTKALVNDVTGVMMWACPAVATVVAIYLFVRRSMADEQDGKLWQKRIVIAIVCGVAGCLASTFINVLSSYY